MKKLFAVGKKRPAVSDGKRAGVRVLHVDGVTVCHTEPWVWKRQNVTVTELRWPRPFSVTEPA